MNKQMTCWTETTQNQSKLECYLALNRDYTTAEYLKLWTKKNNDKVIIWAITLWLWKQADIDKTDSPKIPDMTMLKPKRCGDRATLPHQCLTMRKLGENHQFQIWINSSWLQNLDTYTQQICFMWEKKRLYLISSMVHQCLSQKERQVDPSVMCSQTNTQFRILESLEFCLFVSFYISFI